MIDLIKRIFKKHGVDRTIYICVFILTIFGIVMIGSASVGQTATKGATYATVNMVKQAIFVAVGYVFMIFLARCFKKSWVNSSTTWVFYFIGIALLLVCLLWSSKGSHAWIKIGPFTIQPSEFMKLIMICFLSFHFGEIEQLCQVPSNISRRKKEELYKRKFWYCIARPILAILVAFVIIGFVQNDLGSALIFAFICMIIFYATPRPYYSKYKKITLVLLVGAIGLAGLSVVFQILKPHQLGRIYTWLNPLSNPTGEGWQLTNALIAFSTGGLFGKGFGSSTQKYGYIPESHNDFISAIIFEELGVVGFMLFLIPYVIIIYKMFDYGIKIEDTKSKLILYGIGTYFFTHLLINVGGVTGFIPMTGVPLLLISSGGSSTLAAMMSIGVAQSIIAKYNRDKLKEQLN
ncbi:MAG: FtsW/RodA/SpoVE family cell cycle protein [Erysipelotrichales bacterium]|nr:FtsW/RodA/SpoVE family cell cycle protein [Erysipelotrichales bacterium]